MAKPTIYNLIMVKEFVLVAVIILLFLYAYVFSFNTSQINVINLKWCQWDFICNMFFFLFHLFLYHSKCYLPKCVNVKHNFFSFTFFTHIQDLNKSVHYEYIYMFFFIFFVKFFMLNNMKHCSYTCINVKCNIFFKYFQIR